MKVRFTVPSCPKCGQVHEVGPPDDAGWRNVTIGCAAVVDMLDGKSFCGNEYWCGTCDHKWRVPFAEREDA